MYLAGLQLSVPVTISLLFYPLIRGDGNNLCFLVNGDSCDPRDFGMFCCNSSAFVECSSDVVVTEFCGAGAICKDFNQSSPSTADCVIQD